MRSKNLISWLFVMLVAFSGLLFAQPLETIQIGDGTQKFRKPVWSPNGEKLAFWGPGGIYVCKWDGTEQPRKIFDTFGEDLMWASDSELVWWQRKSWKEKQEGKRPKRMEKESVRMVTLSGQETVIKEGKDYTVLMRLHDGTICFYEGDAVSGTPIVLKPGKTGETDPSKIRKVVSHYPPVWDSRIKGRPVFEDTDIWIQSLDGSLKKRVTYGKGYYFPQLSPDGTRILANGFVVLDLNGNELINLSPGSQEISKGIFSGPCGSCSEWAPNSKQIVYLLEIYNDVTEMDEGSELYIVNIDGSGRTQITNTPDEFELDPQWSPDGTKIACYSGNTGKIFVIGLK